VTLPVFKTGEGRVPSSLVGSTPTRFRHFCFQWFADRFRMKAVFCSQWQIEEHVLWKDRASESLKIADDTSIGP